MTRKPATISKDASSEDAAKLILQNNVSCLPVVASDGSIEGIVTWKDLLKAYSHCVDVAWKDIVGAEKDMLAWRELIIQK